MKEYSAILVPKGIAVCEKTDGCLYLLECVEDVVQMKALLNTINIIHDSILIKGVRND